MSASDHAEPRIFLLNVGVNTSQASKAKSPLFTNAQANGRNFCYVPFFITDVSKPVREYPPDCLGFLNPTSRPDIEKKAHSDPDWENLTYGDKCSQPRAGKLTEVRKGDILLFWGVLFKFDGQGWKGFTTKGWYLFGCLRIEEVVSSKTDLSTLSSDIRERALKNVHFRDGNTLQHDHYVFVGQRAFSGLFDKAVDLEVEDEDQGLIYKSFTSAQGKRLRRTQQPKWSSSLRTCRIVRDRSHAEILRKGIQDCCGTDIFKGLSL
ncbi:MAG TPA: hypothetical protein VOA64_08115 [Candidatus Dormibacteraeota bacterium]|nr:hypothetical protein [Candidatus Dormibacteraeota bacterium]